MNFKQENKFIITVYITNFNYGEYLEEAIESVLAQTINNYELIIIDDGSTDKSLEILKKYEYRKNIKFIKQKNKGLNVTNNIALRISKGKYIIRLDADDWLKNNALEILSDHMEKNSDIGLVFADYYKVNKDGQIIEEIRRHDFQEVTLLDQPAHGACTLIRTSCLKSIGGYDESFRCQDGFDLWIRFIQNYKVNNINQPLFYYRQHNKNLTKQEKNILTTRSNILNKASAKKDTNLNVLAVISVRGKNHDDACLSFEKINKKYLLDWTIDSSLKSKKINNIIIDTPDKDIYNYIKKKKNHRLFAKLRDINLANLNTSILLSIKNALLEMEEKHKCIYDAIFQLTIESPFRNQDHLDCAVNIMHIFDTDIVIGVREENDNLYQHTGHGLELVKESLELRLEREDLYREVGSMRLIKRNLFDKLPLEKNLKVGHVILDEKASLRISSKLTWDIVNFISSNNL